MKNNKKIPDRLKKIEGQIRVFSGYFIMRFDEFNKKDKISVVIVVALLISVSVLHFSISVHETIYHDLFDRLYYFPIILSAFFFGLRGGAMVAAAAGILFFLHLKLQWNMYTSTEIMGRYLEIVMYIVIGVITGILSDLEKRHQRQTEEAYIRLSESFEKAKEAARLAAIGRVSAGVAHEIRNPLGGIKGAMEIVSSEFKPDNPKYRFIEIIEKEINRINHIVEDFLNFAKPRNPDLAPAKLNHLLQSVIDLNLENIKRKKISLIYNPDGNIPISYLDANQIKQVFLNVILNSLDLTQEGGSLEIISRRSEDTLEILISDTGCGIKPGTEHRLFEPFYTTRPLGTGMGLAISKQIIEQHKGEISIKNRGDGTKGAVVKIVLPMLLVTT